MALLARPSKIEHIRYDLDTAAKIYAYTKTKEWNQVFRLSADLAEPVIPENLSWAILNIRSRFPTFYVKLCNNFKWKGLRSASDSRILMQDTGVVCQPFDFKSAADKPLFRIMYGEKTVIVEFFHSVTDGTGGLCYLKTLLAAYFERCGMGKTEPCEGVLDYHEQCSEEEMENAFPKYYDKDGERAARKEDDAYQYKPHKESDSLKIFHITFSAEEMKAAVKNVGVSSTEFLAAAYSYAFVMTKPEEDELPIKIQIPMNMRRNFPSKTLRNFSLYTNIIINFTKDDLSMDELFKTVSEQFRFGSSKEELQKIININVYTESMPLTNIAPSFLKSPIIRIGNKLYGERLFTSPLSNLGAVKVPDSMKPHITGFDFAIGATRLNKIYMTSCGYGGNVKVTITENGNDTEVPEIMLDFFKKNGINALLD